MIEWASLFQYQHPGIHPAQILADKIQADGLAGQYGIKQQEQAHGAGGVKPQDDVKMFLRYPALEPGGRVHDHQYHERHAGEIVVDKGQTADQTPGQVLSQVADAEPKGRPVLFTDNQSEHVKERGNPYPPYQRIAKGTDSLL